MSSPSPHHRHSPPPETSLAPATSSPPMDLEITVISAKHLKNVNWRSGDLKPYAVAYLHPDRRVATKPDDSGDLRPVWNETLVLPLPPPPHLLTIDVFHSKPSETPKPLVGTARCPLDRLLDPSGPPIKTLELRRPSGRPQGKIRIKVALRDRPVDRNPQFYHPGHNSNQQFYPPPQTVAHYPVPSSPYPNYGGYGGGYYSAPPAPMSYGRVGGYGGPSAPSEYDYSSVPPPAYYEQRMRGDRMGMGSGVGVGAVEGRLGGLTLEEGAKYEEGKVADRTERDGSGRNDYGDYRARR